MNTNVITSDRRPLDRIERHTRREPAEPAAAGYRVVATDLVAYDDCVFPVASGVDALQAPLPPGVRTIVTNPPFGDLPSQLVPRWLGLLESVGGQLALLLRVLWAESKGGQVLTGHGARQAPADEGRARVVHLGLASGFNADAI